MINYRIEEINSLTSKQNIDLQKGNSSFIKVCLKMYLII